MKIRQSDKEHCRNQRDRGSEKWRIYRENLNWQSPEKVCTLSPFPNEEDGTIIKVQTEEKGCVLIASI